MQPLTTEQKAENCRVAIKMIEDLEPNQMARDLGYWTNNDYRMHGPNHCGAAACLGGYVAAHPHFNALGVTAGQIDGAPQLPHTFWPGEIADYLFGDEDIFGAVNEGELVDPPLDERGIVLHRLNRALKALQA